MDNSVNVCNFNDMKKLLRDIYSTLDENFHCSFEEALNSIFSNLKKEIKIFNANIQDQKCLIDYDFIDDECNILLNYVKNKATIEKVFDLFDKEKWIDGSSCISNCEDSLHWYRIRTGSYSDTYKPIDLYYFKYSQKEQQNEGRFNLKGVPCLYLSGQVMTSIIETRFPKEFYVGTFYFKKNNSLKLLVIPNATEFFDNCFNDLNFTKNFYNLFPIFIACNIRANNGQQEFYKISQALSEWIRKSKDYDGILYWTTRINDFYVKDPNGKYNIALPSNWNDSNDYCKKVNESIEIGVPQYVNLSDCFSINKISQSLDSFLKSYKKEFRNEEKEKIQFFKNKLEKREIDEDFLLCIDRLYLLFEEEINKTKNDFFSDLLDLKNHKSLYLNLDKVSFISQFEKNKMLEELKK